MFLQARRFNQPLGNWDVSNVKNMREMFSYAFNFNQPLDDWDTSNVKDIKGAFTDSGLTDNKPKWYTQRLKNL